MHSYIYNSYYILYYFKILFLGFLSFFFQMKVFIALFALLAVVAASPLIDPQLDDLWESFKAKYWKTYDGIETEIVR